MKRDVQDEGWYEYASDHHEANEGDEEAHIEPAVLYQPLGEAASDDDSFGDEWRRILIEYGSRCEQYGGHWKGHRCVGVRTSRRTAKPHAARSQRPWRLRMFGSRQLGFPSQLVSGSARYSDVGSAMRLVLSTLNSMVRKLPGQNTVTRLAPAYGMWLVP
ncbi:MAG TPA: hypothetical protein VIH71_14010, partial [Solirubrobacteraceae bacterium]